MSEINRIHIELQRVFEGNPAWHGPSILSLLEDVTADQAAARPFNRSHTIWELVVHVRIWADEVRTYLEGNTFRWLEVEEDWPQIHDISEKEWAHTIDDLKRAHKQLLKALLQFDESHLDSKVPCDSSVPNPWSSTTFYTLLNGISQHATYHAGQIAQLKKG